MCKLWIKRDKIVNPKNRTFVYTDNVHIYCCLLEFLCNQFKNLVPKINWEILRKARGTEAHLDTSDNTDCMSEHVWRL